MPFQPAALPQEAESRGMSTVTVGGPGQTFRIAQPPHRNQALCQG